MRNYRTIKEIDDALIVNEKALTYAHLDYARKLEKIMLEREELLNMRDEIELENK